MAYFTVQPTAPQARDTSVIGEDGGMKPMLATVADGIPAGPEWVHEVKWDGMRILADVSAAGLRLTSRNGNDVTRSFPELGDLPDAYEDLLLDGEVVALDGGRPSFRALAERMHVTDQRKAERLATTRPVTFMIFDLVRLFGSDLTAQPWSARRELLERLDLQGRHWQVPPVYDDGQELWEATRDNGLEGIVSKRRSSTYVAGRRSPDWRKKSHRQSISAVVGGWRPETGSTARLGAVLVGLPNADGTGWRYAGRVGSGLAGKVATGLKGRLEPLARPDPPFTDEVPREDASGAFWVEPTVVVEVKTLGGSDQERLRQPSFIGIRHDLRPEDLLDA
jgi:bifunctional non-homologous end joining protein LigD